VTRLVEIEDRLSRLWERNLGVPSSRTDDYFASGGDSLRGTQLIGWIHDSFGVELSLLDLFEARTIEAHARLLASRIGEPRVEAHRPPTEYLFFGPDATRLFGALHRPAAGATAGVVLAYPIGQEYIRIHRTYVELARALAASGRVALRFDYRGCGDSAGDTSSGELDGWRDDVVHAIHELRVRAGVDTVYVLGARVGANLVRTLDGAAGIAGLILWEPILDGTTYLESLRHAHDALLRGNAVLDGYEERTLPGGLVELLGYPITPRLHAQLAALDLQTDVAPAATPTLVLAGADKPALASYAAARRVEYVATGEPDGIWLAEDRQNKGVIPARAVQAVAGWLDRRGA
jgi:aryl carrier-like protein